MKIGTMSIIAISLWALTVIAVAVKFTSGTTEPQADGRTAVILSEPEREFVLMEMRQLLESVQGVIGGISQGDYARIEKAARASGAAAPRAAPPELMLNLPAGFKKTGMSVHKGFDDIADAAGRGESKAQLLERVYGQLSTCVGCHAAFRLSIKG